LPPALREAALPLKREKVNDSPPPEGETASVASGGGRFSKLRAAIHKTVDYAKLFQYPLHPDEIYDRLFEVKVDKGTFKKVLNSLQLEPDAELLETRATREAISDTAIREAIPYLHTLASIPFIRMIAFSGATAHRNMTSSDDVDLFIVVEDGKLWAAFLLAMLWAKAKGLRKRLCMNYLISDAALPLAETDVFTAQQAASLKPIFGKGNYDRFHEMNPFVRVHFPNLDLKRHRDAYPEIQTRKLKSVLEGILRLGPIQIVEQFSRFVLSRNLEGKRTPDSELHLDARRLKLHLRGHRTSILSLNPASRSLAATSEQCHQHNVEVEA
jgi:hypothetical protein